MKLGHRLVHQYIWILLSIVLVFLIYRGLSKIPYFPVNKASDNVEVVASGEHGLFELIEIDSIIDYRFTASNNLSVPRLYISQDMKLDKADIPFSKGIEVAEERLILLTDYYKQEVFDFVKFSQKQ